MVEQAQKQTKAAEDSVLETRRIGEAQTRAYLSIERGRFMIRPDNNYPEVTLLVRNTGNSPARQITVSYRAAFTCQNISRVQPGFAPIGRSPGFGKDIAAARNDELTHIFGDFPMGDTERAALSEGKIVQFRAIARVEFLDVFENLISEEQDWFGFIEQLGKKQHFVRIPFTSFRLTLPPPRRPRQPASAKPETSGPTSAAL